jgi:hypothetical protein
MNDTSTTEISNGNKICPGEGGSRAASNYFCFTIGTCEAYKGTGLNGIVQAYKGTVMRRTYIFKALTNTSIYPNYNTCG